MLKFTSKADLSEVDRVLSDARDKARNVMKKEGEAFVERARESGSYRDRTGHLRASNFYRMKEGSSKDTLEMGNSAGYASDVESRGFSVCSDEVLETERRLKEALG